MAPITASRRTNQFMENDGCWVHSEATLKGKIWSKMTRWGDFCGRVEAGL